jgi:type II secretory pathway pseudopilin PulG
MKPDDKGETLLELLIAVVILSIAVVAIVGGIGVSVMMSDIHRKQTTAGAYAKDYAEAIESTVAGGGYVSCVTGTSYPVPTSLASDPVYTGYSAALVVTSVRYWNGTGWQPTCVDKGVEMLTVRASSSDQRATEQVVVVLRKPCGPGSSCT